MGNGGSPPAHLSSSSLSDPSWWLQFKWSQPPPRAPECGVLLTLPAGDILAPPVSSLSTLEDLVRANAAGITELREMIRANTANITVLSNTVTTNAATVTTNDLWADEHHCLCLVEEQAARARQEEDGCRQKLLDAQAARARQEDAARARQEAAARARQEETAARARQEAAARARQEAAHACKEEASRCQQLLNEAARTIFLWLRRRRLHVQLTRQTSRQKLQQITARHGSTIG